MGSTVSYKNILELQINALGKAITKPCKKVGFSGFFLDSGNARYNMLV